MASHENEFELRLGRIGRDDAPSLKRVRATVRRSMKPAGGPKARLAPRTGIRAHVRMGSAGKGRPVIVGQRRVVVKARYAVHGSGHGAPLHAHVAYLAREVKTAERVEPELDRSVDYLSREESEGQARFAFYDRAVVGVDAKAVTAGWAEDSRHFRFIISPEDGEALGDLKPFIREVMEGLETRLGTKLEWLAVDHWDTDNPHTHVLVRGRRADGQDLFIPSRLISSGIREHAEEIVTRVLGPRLGADLAKERWREISHAGVTPLDQELVASLGRDGIVSAHRPDQAARLERLEGWDLAQRSEWGWRIADGVLGKLKALEERQAIEQAVSVHRKAGEVLPLLEADRETPEQGRLVHLGPADELGDGFLAVIETGQGELRYARFEKADDLARLQDAAPGAIVEFRPNVPAMRPSDEAIARIAKRTGGLYSIGLHAQEEPRVGPSLMEANIRRLEAMRRAGLVQRSSGGVFLVGDDYPARALRFEERTARRNPVTANVLSYWMMEEQLHAFGPTHLDRVLAGEAALPQGTGAFAREHEIALQQRRLFLIQLGWLGPDERRLSRSALKKMSDRELRDLARKLSSQLGKPVLTAQLNRVRGVYAQRINLAQGRVALIDAGRHAVLVPWRPPLERFAGREVEGVMRGQGLSWGLARETGLGLGSM